MPSAKALQNAAWRAAREVETANRAFRLTERLRAFRVNHNTRAALESERNSLKRELQVLCRRFEQVLRELDAFPDQPTPR